MWEGVVLEFFFKKKVVTKEANWHTHGAAESLPEQRDGPCLPSAWHPESRAALTAITSSLDGKAVL